MRCNSDLGNFQVVGFDDKVLYTEGYCHCGDEETEEELELAVATPEIQQY